MSAASETEVFVFEGYSLNSRQRLLVAPDGRSLPLSARAFDTLLYLVEHPNQLIDKQTLMKAVWPNVIVEENNLSQNISIVRRALGETAGEHRFIVTVPGRGFRFVPPVTRGDTALAARPPEPLQIVDRRKSDPDALVTGALHGRRFGAKSLGALAAILVVAGAVVWALIRRDTEHATAPIAAAVVAAPSTSAGAITSVAPRTSVAVMPFVNLTGDASKDYLGDGMAEEVINTLTQVPGLKVPARTSSFAYKGRNTDIRQICRDLGVGTILEGSVRTAGKRIRITAQLIDAQDGLNIWSHTYDEQFSDLFKLQDNLATAIVEALQVSLNGASPPSVTRAPPTQDVDAYNLYLQGNAVAQIQTEQGQKLAMDFYGQALERDPKFARAFAARSGVRLVSLMVGHAPAHALEEAEHDAERALALDPNLGDAHDAVAATSAFRGNWLKAETSVRAALAVDPNSPDSHRLYSQILLGTGRLHQALAEANMAYQLAPADKFVILTKAAINNFVAHDAEAVKYADLAVAMGIPPNMLPLPQIYSGAALNGARYTEAADRLVPTLAAPIRSAGGAEVIRLVYATLGDPTKKPAALQALQRLVDSLGKGNIDESSRSAFVVWFCMLDALDPAYDLANQSLAEFARSGSGGGPVWGYLWVSGMRSFRQDSRFQQFVTRLNLIDYWKQYGPPDSCDLKDGKLACR
jgi:TolB-like protein/DNA-binding winged helix-turn-helix (wHTH) protein